MTFLVQRESVDIIFKIKKGCYLTVSVNQLSDNRFLLACNWDSFFNRLKRMKNRNEALVRLNKTCASTSKIFVDTNEIHFVYLDKECRIGAIALIMKAPSLTNSIADFIHDKVISKAMELMEYNLNVYVEITEYCPFIAWKNDLKRMMG